MSIKDVCAMLIGESVTARSGRQLAVELWNFMEV
jgi:hypothetical protein